MLNSTAVQFYALECVCGCRRRLPHWVARPCFKGSASWTRINPSPGEDLHWKKSQILVWETEPESFAFRFNETDSVLPSEAPAVLCINSRFTHTLSNVRSSSLILFTLSHSIQSWKHVWTRHVPFLVTCLSTLCHIVPKINPQLQTT